MAKYKVPVYSFHIMDHTLHRYYMKEAILEGEVPLIKAYGKDPMESIHNDKRFAPIFFDAMREFNPLVISKILKEYKGFEGLKSIVDVGGGNGSILKAIISRYPSIEGTNFDLPPIIEKQPIYPGIQHVAGDMFTSIPAGDAIFMKVICIFFTLYITILVSPFVFDSFGGMVNGNTT